MVSSEQEGTRFEMQMDILYRQFLNSLRRAVLRDSDTVAARVMILNGAHTIDALYVAVATVVDALNSATEFASSANGHGIYIFPSTQSLPQMSSEDVA